MARPSPGFGTRFSRGRIGRGLFRQGGQFQGVRFSFVPEWEKNTLQEIRPSGDKYVKDVHQAMCDGMRAHSRRRPGGGTERTDEGWQAGIGSPPSTRTHWHLLEFGGGFHYPRAGVRRALDRMGKFKPSGKGG